MSHQNNINNLQQPINNDDNYENDDLIAFQLDSKSINIYYSQLAKYSKQIRDSYLFSDVINRFPQEIIKFKEDNHLTLSSLFSFFQFLHQNCNIKEDVNLTYIQCIDLLKISKYLEIRKLFHKINEYIKNRNFDVDFVIQMIQYDFQTQNQKNHEIEIRKDVENLLVNKIDECFLNEKFSELPISIIDRIVEQSSMNQMINDNLFDFIKKSISKFCVLFRFLDLQKLSENRLEELCEIYAKSDENSQKYFNYMKCNLKKLEEMIRQKKEIQKQLDSTTKLNKNQQSQLIELSAQIEQLKKQKKVTEDINNEQQRKIEEFEAQIKQLKDMLKNTDKEKDEMKKKLKDADEVRARIEEEKKKMQEQLNDAEISKKELKKQLKKMACKIKGQIVASEKRGLVIGAIINLTLNGTSLDTKRSKYIISTRNEKVIGSEAYAKGELITSKEMNTVDFICKSGTYYVRCLVFNSEGESTELVSNSVTTSGTSVLFKYEGKAATFSLQEGEYKFEVWGAKGGDSEGTRFNSSSPGTGGLGGYSIGIVNLRESKKIHIFVGGEGRIADSKDGATTNGGFPDGGGTKTGHGGSYTCVPGTGGGSTSIRIGCDSDYARVIVAGGGGGASGDGAYTANGGFGGGLSGGNCFFVESLLSQGAGTQTGSTCGRGRGQNGNPGSFGQGATGKYRHGVDSGGGGGGGWYGGGSGGYGGLSSVSSGGGGSGWVFTKSSFSAWQAGDPNNSSKFELGQDFFLSAARTVGGEEDFPRPDGNGTERGHAGNGYAKITPE